MSTELKTGNQCPGAIKHEPVVHPPDSNLAGQPLRAQLFIHGANYQEFYLCVKCGSLYHKEAGKP